MYGVRDAICRAVANLNDVMAPWPVTTVGVGTSAAGDAAGDAAGLTSAPPLALVGEGAVVGAWAACSVGSASPPPQAARSVVRGPAARSAAAPRTNERRVSF